MTNMNSMDIDMIKRRQIVAGQNLQQSIENDAAHGGALHQKLDRNDPRSAAYKKVRELKDKIELAKLLRGYDELDC